MNDTLRAKVFALFQEEQLEYVLAGCKLHTQLGLDVSLMLNDGKYTFITRGHDRAEYCTRVREFVKKPQTCNACDEYHFRGALNRQEPWHYRCHAFLRDFTVTVFDRVSGDAMAVLFGGQVLIEEEFRDNEQAVRDSISALAIANGADPAILLNAFEQSIRRVPKAIYDTYAPAIQNLARDIGLHLSHYARSVVQEYCTEVEEAFTRRILEGRDTLSVWKSLWEALAHISECWDIARMGLYVWNPDRKALQPVQELLGAPCDQANHADIDRRFRDKSWSCDKKGRLLLPANADDGAMGVLEVVLREPERRSDAYFKDVSDFCNTLLKYTALRLKALDAYADLQRKHTELVRTNKVMEDLTATLAHQTASPLTSIRDTAERFIDEMDNLNRVERTQRATAIYNIAADGCSMMLAVLDAMDTRVVQKEAPEEVDVAKLIEKIKRSRSYIVHNRQLSIRVRLDEDMEKMRLRSRVFLHVLYVVMDNAIKYSDRGEDIYVRGHSERGQLNMEIESRGAEILSEEVDHIFTRGFRGNTAKHRDSGGSGMGLWIARTLLQLVGGSISVQTHGKRTTFLFSIPNEL